MFPNTFNKTKSGYIFSRAFLIFSISVSLVLLALIVWKTHNFYKYNSFKNSPARETYIARNAPAVENSSTQIQMDLSEVNEIVMLFSVTFSILFILAIYFFGKSIRDSFLIEKSRRILRKEKHAREVTQKQLNQTHNELHATNNQLREIIEGTTDLIASIDCDFNLLFFNKSFAADYARIFSRDVRRGENVISALSGMPEKAKFAEKLWRRALNGEKFVAEQSYKNEFGDPIYYELNYSPILNETGKVIGATQIARDVTSRILEANETENERNFVSAVFEASSSLVMVLNREGRIIKFNKACENLTGFAFEEVQNKIIWDVLVPTEEIKIIKKSFRKLDGGDIDGDYSNHLITKDEVLKFVSWKISSIRDENNEVQFIVATGIDITEKEQSEKARDRMLSILENSKDFIGLTDLSYNLKYLNAAGRQFLEIGAEAEISKIKIYNCLTENSSKTLLKEAIPQTIKRGSWIGEVDLKTGKKEIPASLLLLSHKNKFGNVEYLSVVARDVSDVKEMKFQLQEVQDMAQESSRLKSDFLANMSHEIRTPMNGVTGMTELLLQTDLNEQQKDLVDTIRTSSDTLLNIINDILDFSKINAGKLKFETIDFDVRQAVEEVVKLFTKDVCGEKLELLTIVYDDVPGKISGDPVRLKQILTNLVGNALKFTEQGEIVVRVRLLEQAGANLKLKFTVKDSGIGIEKDQQKHIFSEFVQADKTIQRKYGGTGLGLAISKKLVDLMNGEIGFESQAGRGSEFWFTAEFAQTVNLFYPASEEAAAAAERKILIVENNETARKILLYHAKSIGVFCEAVATPESALEILRKSARNGEPFEMVLIDDQFSKTGGIDLVSEISTSPLMKKTSICLMFNKYDSSQTQYASRLGVNDFVYKPIKQTDFQNKLKNLLGIKNMELVIEKESAPDAPNHSFDKFTAQYSLLIAEDNAINQKVIINQLKGFGFEIDLVQNGLEVLEALQTKKYDLILMDCQMPYMDGFETTVRIRESPDANLQNIPIIAVTAQAIDGDRDRCIRGGMNDYISKPTNQKLLIAKLDKWLTKKDSLESIDNSENFENFETCPSDHDQTEAAAIKLRMLEIHNVADAELVLECIDLFTKDSRYIIEKLEDALEMGDFQLVITEAHKLKGSSANMGAQRLPILCSRLIKRLRANNFEGVSQMIAGILSEYETLTPIYKKEKRRFEIRRNEIELIS